MSKIYINVNANGYGTVELDGQDLGPLVLRAEVRIRSGRRPSVVLELCSEVVEVELDSADTTVEHKAIPTNGKFIIGHETTPGTAPALSDRMKRLLGMNDE